MSVESEMRVTYVARGWKIIPVASVDENGVCKCYNGPSCPNPGKHALIKGWNDPLLIIDWSQFPDDVSLGLVTGDQPNGDRITVLDIDARSGGIETWNDQLADVFPATANSSTGGGGFHFIYRLPPDVDLRPVTGLFPGVDLKAGNGAYVVLPPSRHASGRRYAWASSLDEELATLYEDCIDIIVSAQEKKRSSGDLMARMEAGEAFTKEKLEEILDKGVFKGNRNTLMYRLACSEARRLGSDLTKINGKNDLLMRMDGYNKRGCRPNLSDIELRTLVESAFDFISSDKANVDIELDPELLVFINQQSRRPSLTGGASLGSNEAETIAPEPIDLSDDQQTVVNLPAIVSSAPSTDLDTTPPGTNLPAIRTGSSVTPPNGPVIGTPPVLDAPNERSMDDRGNAARFVDFYQYDFKFVPDGGNWRYWNGHHWVEDVNNTRVMFEAQNIDRLINLEAAIAYTNGNTVLGDDLTRWRRKCGDMARIKNIVPLARNHQEIQLLQRNWNPDTSKLLAKNGVINLRTGGIEDIEQDLYMTEAIGYNYRPGAWNLDDEDGRRFRKFIDDLTDGDKEYARYLQKAAGYTLTSETNEEVFFFIVGPSNKGKSTFIEALRNISGSYAGALSSDQVTAKRANDTEEIPAERLCGYESKRLVIISELPEGSRLKSNIVKKLTGRDTLNARRLYAATSYTFVPQFKIWMDSNHKPLIADEGVWRRMRAIPFDSKRITVANADRTLKDWLHGKGAELFLSWAVDGCVRWYKEGLGTCARVDGASTDYREDEDIVGIFLEDIAVAIDSDVSTCTVGDLYDWYRDWVDARGEHAFLFRNFLTRMKERGFRVDGRSKKSAIYGLLIKSRSRSEVDEQTADQVSSPMNDI